MLNSPTPLLTKASFEQDVLESQDQISVALKELIPEQNNRLHEKLFQAARYSLLSSGKRLRPLLALMTADIFLCPREKVLKPACALELIHTYSLIHDDLPCMDDDDLRRGKPTLHKVYDEGHAVLTGDFLLTYAFEVLSESPHLSSEQKLQLIHTLAIRSGAEGMIGGQVVDLITEGLQIDWTALEFIHLGKTASLIEACVEFGCIIAEVSKEDRVHLKRFGKTLGLAFQIVDDILDASTLDERVAGSKNSDAIHEKATAVSILGMPLAKQKAEELLASSLDALSQLSRPAPKLSFLAEKLVGPEALNISPLA
ncbi:MAG: polyprenyl synthetase family protein [Anaerolineae bacterium]